MGEIRKKGNIYDYDTPFIVELVHALISKKDFSSFCVRRI